MDDEIDFLRRKYRQEIYRARRTNVPQLKRSHEASAEHFRERLQNLDATADLIGS